MANLSSVRIAMLTYHRPDELRRVIPLLQEQLAGLDGSLHADLLVIDNDPQGSGHRVMSDIAPEVLCVVESRAGIAAARNRALAESTDIDWLVFIDDDETPEPGWLAALLDTAQGHDCQAVAGAVTTIYPEEMDPWVVAGGFFDRRHRDGVPTGTAIPEAATNNLALDMRFVRRHNLWFAEDLGLTGGEDSWFTRQLVAAGGRIVWCAEARVLDPLPAQRATREHAWRRALSHGNTTALLEVRELDSVPKRVRRFGQGTARMLSGLGLSALGTVTRHQQRQASGARMAARGAGMALGSVNIGYQEYGRGRSKFFRQRKQNMTSSTASHS